MPVGITGIDLASGVLTPISGHRIVCFFIVEHTSDEGIMEKETRQLLVAGCRNFTFFGRYHSEWHNVADLEDVRRGFTDDDFAETVSTPDFDMFVDEIFSELSCRPFVPTDKYLIYDDIGLYNQVIRAVEKHMK